MCVCVCVRARARVCVVIKKHIAAHIFPKLSRHYLYESSTLDIGVFRYIDVM